AFHHVAPSLELPHFLALGHLGTDAGWGEEGGNTGAAGTNALGQGSLGGQLDLDLSREHLLLEYLVFADVARDHLGDLLVLEQVHQTVIGGAGVVGDDREAFGAEIAQRGDAFLGYASEAKASDEDRDAVGDIGAGGAGVGENLVHGA